MIFFSVYLNSNNESTNVKNTLQVKRHLDRQGIQNRIVVGSYNGVEELSFQVGSEFIQEALYIAGLYYQESVLVVTNGKGTLLYLNDDELIQESIGAGILSNVKDAFKHEAYTVLGDRLLTFVKAGV